ncbi:MAG: hypothetical protein JNM27_18085 [Leptospirales bacterium]|nr:hypothetical protein [Leptospirales bacterium]
MEKILQDILNAGIALFRAGEGTVQNAVKEVQRTFEQLKEKGAQDNSEQAVKLRKLLDDIVHQSSGLSGKAGTAYTDALTQLEQLYANVLDQIKKLVPPERINEIKDKMEELSRVIQQKKSGGASA